MELVSLFCFGESGQAVEPALFGILMSYVIHARAKTKDFSPFPEHGVDATPVVRSFLLQQLLRSRWDALRDALFLCKTLWSPPPPPPKPQVTFHLYHFLTPSHVSINWCFTSRSYPPVDILSLRSFPPGHLSPILFCPWSFISFNWSFLPSSFISQVLSPWRSIRSIHCSVKRCLTSIDFKIVSRFSSKHVAELFSQNILM